MLAWLRMRFACGRGGASSGGVYSARRGDLDDGAPPGGGDRERAQALTSLAVDNYVAVVSSLLPASITSKTATIKVRNTADGLGPDVLRALQRQSPSGKLYQRWLVEYAGEEGVDEGGLLVDLFSKVFPHLRAAQGTRRLFEAPTPDEEVEVLLPLADADWEAAFPRGVPLEPPSAVGAAGAAASSSSGGGGGGGSEGDGGGGGGGARKRQRTAAAAEESVPVEEALSLCGRLLAKALIEGSSCCVDDALPMYVLEYLVTDNVESLDTIGGALAAMEATRPGQARLYRLLLAPGGVAHLEGVYDGALKESDLIESPSRPDVTSTHANALVTEETKQEAVLRAVRHQLFSERRRSLEALKEGFQGMDQPRSGTAASQQFGCYNFQHLLASLPPMDIALRLRGQPVRGGGDVWSHLRFVRHDIEFKAEGETKMLPAPEDKYGLVQAWLERLVCDDPDRGGFKREELRDFVHFCTSRKTFRAFVAHDPARDDIVVRVYAPPPGRGYCPTASTCNRELQLPCGYADAAALSRGMREALQNHRCNEELQEDRVSFAYS